ncbi:MAG: two-component sensor histidine kinase, partial [Polaromonas sp.]|nr:two-component sensor histidine kinase [Polaromonas sp.]
MTPASLRQASLTRRLLLWVLAALLLVWAGFAAVGWRTGVHEAGELTDGQLASTAALMLNLDLPPFVEASRETARAVIPSLKNHDYQPSLSVLVRDAGGRVLARSGDAPLAPFSEQAGFADLALGTPPALWRSFSQWDATHARQVMVLVRADERDELASDVAGQLAEPGLWLLPAVAIALCIAIWRGLRPLQALSRDVAELEVDKAERLQARHPYREFNSVVRSINTLMGQQQASLERERQLASEVAHELRTPLS